MNNSNKSLTLFQRLDLEQKRLESKNNNYGGEGMYDDQRFNKRGGSQLPTGRIPNKINQSTINSVLNAEPILDNKQFNKGSFGSSAVSSHLGLNDDDTALDSGINNNFSETPLDSQNINVNVNSINDISIEKAISDIRIVPKRLFEHIEKIHLELSENPLRKFAIGVATLQSMRRTDYYLTDVSKIFLKQVKDYQIKTNQLLHGPSSFSANQIRQYSEILRSVAYSINSSIPRNSLVSSKIPDIMTNIDRTHENITKKSDNISSSSSSSSTTAKPQMRSILPNNTSNINHNYIDLFRSAANDLNQLLFFNQRLKRLFSASNAMSRDSFYFTDKLISLTDQAMTEIQNRAPPQMYNLFVSTNNRPAQINATRLIFTSQSLSCNLQRMVANISNQTRITSRPSTQIEIKIIGDAISNYSRLILTEIINSKLISTPNTIGLDYSEDFNDNSVSDSSFSNTSSGGDGGGGNQLILRKKAKGMYSRSNRRRNRRRIQNNRYLSGSTYMF